ncbi:MAG TPA: rRNA adenine N-6-methyltransferase family protein [Verrucomicrobiae bacterium]|nr:rRNA adenine N-6-methyltransferase family protein [Verrucomicrobiae bacterium]
MKAAIAAMATRARQPGRMFLFALNFVKHPKMLGTPFPSPRLVVDQILKRINWQEARVIVEYGPGVGNITTEILRRMQPGAILLAIETNGEFTEYLRETLSDSRLHVVHGSAADVATWLAQLGCRQVDYVISGIPFSTIPGTVREGILRATHAVLRPHGVFLVYQYSRQVLPSLKKTFGRVHRNFMLFKVVPMWLFHCWR